MTDKSSPSGDMPTVIAGTGGGDSPTVVAGSLPGGAHGAKGALVGLELNGLFELTRFIAQGGMGEVYEGRNVTSGERVAVKVILAQFAADEQFMALFRREASVLERIGHDVLVKYRTLAFDRTAQLTYLVTEYVDGPPLSERLDGTPADPADVVRLLRRLATGLAAAHEAGVIHRDLSPDNVLLGDGRVERAKIIDFGIARGGAVGEKSVVGDAFAGKLGYAAPEIFGKYGRDIGPWTDVYSLALLVLAYARGKPMAMGNTIFEALTAREEVPDLSFLPAAQARVFAGMLEPNPAQRLRSMEAVLAALDAPDAPPAAQRPAQPAPDATILAPLPAAALAPAASADAPSPAKRRPAIAAIAGLVLLAGGVGGYFALNRPEKPVVQTAEQAAEQAVEQAAALRAAAQQVTGQPGAATPAPPTPPEPPGASWDSVRGEVAVALESVPCSALRIDGTPAGGIVRLSGWYPSGAAIPARVAGWRIDAGGAAPVAPPSAGTCRLVQQLQAALGGPGSRHLGFDAVRQLELSALPKTADGLVLPAMRVSALPGGYRALTVISIADKPATESDRVAAATLNGRNLERQLAEIPYDPIAKRYLVYVVARKGPQPFDFAIGKDLDRLQRDGAAGGCARARGWLDIR